MENTLHRQGKTNIAGCDEAGRGALAGPLVAAAVILPAQCRFAGLRDSKLLTPLQREYLYKEITRRAKSWNVSVMPVETIDDKGVHRANLNALAQAVQGLAVRPDHVVSDGFVVRLDDIPCTAVIAGDAKVRCIAAASVIAKVFRDRLMCNLHEQYPRYGFAIHKGYGTRAHQRALRRFGPSPFHRTSFAPIRALLTSA